MATPTPTTASASRLKVPMDGPDRLLTTHRAGSPALQESADVARRDRAEGQEPLVEGAEIEPGAVLLPRLVQDIGELQVTDEIGRELRRAHLGAPQLALGFGLLLEAEFPHQ